MRCCPISDLYRSFLKNYGDPTARSYRPPPAPEDKLNATADATKAHRIFQLRQLLTDPGNGEDSTKKRDEFLSETVEYFLHEIFTNQQDTFTLFGESADVRDFLDNRIDLEKYDEEYGHKFPTQLTAGGDGCVFARDLLNEYPQHTDQIIASRKLDNIFVRNGADILVAKKMKQQDDQIKKFQLHLAELIKHKTGTLSLKPRAYGFLGTLPLLANATPVFTKVFGLPACNINILWGQLLLNATSSAFWLINHYVGRISTGFAEMGAVYDYFIDKLKDAAIVGLIEKKDGDDGKTTYELSPGLQSVTYILALTWKKIFQQTGSKFGHFHGYRVAHLSIFMFTALMKILEEIKQKNPDDEAIFTDQFISKVSDAFAKEICSTTSREYNPLILFKGSNPLTHRHFDKVSPPPTFILLALECIKGCTVEGAFRDHDYTNDEAFYKDIKSAIKSLLAFAHAKQLNDDIVQSHAFRRVLGPSNSDESTTAFNAPLQLDRIDLAKSRVLAATSIGIDKRLGVSNGLSRFVFSLARNNTLGFIAQIVLYGTELPEWLKYSTALGTLVLTPVFEWVRASRKELAETQSTFYQRFDSSMMTLIAKDYFKIPEDVTQGSDIQPTNGFRVLQYLATSSIQHACTTAHVAFRSFSATDQALLGAVVFDAYARVAANHKPTVLERMSLRKINEVISDATSVIVSFISTSVLHNLSLCKLAFVALDRHAINHPTSGRQLLENNVREAMKSLKIRARTRVVTFADDVDSDPDSDLHESARAATTTSGGSSSLRAARRRYLQDDDGDDLEHAGGTPPVSRDSKKHVSRENKRRRRKDKQRDDGSLSGDEIFI